MTDIANFAEFDARLARARAGMNRLNLENPGDAFLQSISRQLTFVYDWTRGGKRPPEDEIKKVSFGVMASRSVDELDPELAGELYVLANYLDNWK
ncbi:MAG TPA: immunity protein Tsi6 family protein [Candidatus Solibacter sp.]|nr:immunity protein Tsi6 family protein [Candidatus Solibacter sp.]